MKKPHRYLILGLLVLAVGIWLVRPAVATPPISWTPASVAQAVVVGEQPLQVTVSFTSDSDLGAVEVRVVPELDAFVAVVPREPFEVAAGETVTLALSLSAESLDLLGPVDGALQVRNASDPPQTHARPLPIQLDIQPFPLPPNPGEAGKKTLEGIDSDEDGVRDDVQRYIAFEYPSEPATRAALAQFAVPALQALVDSDDADLAWQHAKAKDRARECFRFVQGIPIDGDVISALLAETLNTRERSRAYLEHDHQLAGQVFSLSAVDKVTACDFDPSNPGGVP